MNAEPGKVLRIAVVGCGRMGLQHAKSSVQLGHRVTVACDVDSQRAAALASAHPDCVALADPNSIPWDEVDAAFICTPPFARGPVESCAAKAGVPLFLEKPVGLSALQLAPVLAAVREAGVVTSVGYMNRYRPSVQRARALLAADTPLGFAAHWFGAAYRVPWWGDPALSGGQLNEQCTHLVDLARHLVGEVVEANALAQPLPHPGRGSASVSIALRFASGALGTIVGGCLALEKQIGCRVFTPRGQIALEGWDFRWSPSAPFGEGKDLESADPFLCEAAAFLGAAISGDASAVLCDVAEAMKTQRVVDAIAAAVAPGEVRQGIEGAGVLPGGSFDAVERS
jgi:myo-inositol 2-dehydrogenase / D-chiro-inositol 1-dehydrogenase